MKLIESSVQLIKQEGALEGMFRHIELCGRTCYKSEDKITEDSAKEFVDKMIKSGHNAMLEHGTVYLTFYVNQTDHYRIVKYPWYYDNKESNLYEVYSYIQSIFMCNPYTKVNIHTDYNENKTIMAITTNYRVIVENGLEDIMKEFITEPTEYHTPRITLKFTTNIGVTREGNRMRANSIAEESTRYCDYTKEKHGNGELNIVPPVWINKELFNDAMGCFIKDWYDIIERMLHAEFGDNLRFTHPEDYYFAAIAFSNICYNNLRRLGWAPQQAREVLPLATKSDVVYTAFPHQWKHFFDLRMFGTTGAPHPNMKDIATKAAEVLLENDLWKLIYPGEDKIPAHVGENK